MSRTLALITTLDGGGGGFPDNSLPGIPGHPDQGLPGGGGAPDQGLPTPPPGVWPPPSAAHPIVPAPGVPPGAIWPPVGGPPTYPDQGLPGGGGGGSGGAPDQGLPGGSPGKPDQGLPGGGKGTFWIVAGIPGVGWRYVCVDPSLKPDQGLPGSQPGVDNTLPGGRPPHVSGQPIPGGGNRPGNALPPTAQPKS